MYDGQTVGVVVPAYDEEGFVGEVIETMPEFVDRIYPVDDCSTDGTWAEIRSHAERVNERAAESGAVADGGRGLYRGREADAAAGSAAASATESDVSPTTDPDTTSATAQSTAESDARSDRDARRVVPLRHERNRGVGAAIKTGYRRAYEDGVDVVAVMAGDGQMDPEVLDRLLDPVVEGRADYVKGNRLLSEEYREEMSDWRLFGNNLLTLLTKVSSGYWKMMDPQNGYTAISREAIGRLDLDSVFDDYGFTNAMLVHCNVADLTVADVPTPARYGDEESDIRYSTFVPQLSALLARGFGWRLKRKHLLTDFHPLAFLYGLGVAGTLGGIVATIRNWRAGRNDRSDERAEPRAGTDSEPTRSDPTGDSEMNATETNRTTGCGPLTALVGLVTTVLAMAFDAAENDDLFVSVDHEEVDE